MLDTDCVGNREWNILQVYGVGLHMLENKWYLIIGGLDHDVPDNQLVGFVIDLIAELFDDLKVVPSEQLLHLDAFIIYSFELRTSNQRQEIHVESFASLILDIKFSPLNLILLVLDVFVLHVFFIECNFNASIQVIGQQFLSGLLRRSYISI